MAMMGPAEGRRRPRPNLLNQRPAQRLTPCRHHGAVSPDTVVMTGRGLCSPTMSLLRVAPEIDVHSDQIRGCTAWAAQLLVLFAYARYVTIDRRRRRVTVSIRLLWLWKVERIIPFDRVARIIYRAQGVPSFSPLRYLLLQGGDVVESAFYYISLGIKANADDKHAREELALFSVWEQQPRAPDMFDKLAGVRTNPNLVGDEVSGAIVDMLREYLAVPIASH
jgi:hypothetical protein